MTKKKKKIVQIDLDGVMDDTWSKRKMALFTEMKEASF